MKKFKFKEELSKDKKREQIEKLINVDSIPDDETRYGHIYRVLKMLGFSPKSCRNLMTEKYHCTNYELIENAITMTDRLEFEEFETNSPFVDINCTDHIDNHLNPEDDLVLHQDKKGNKKYLKIEELKYYYFRLTKKVFDSGGYMNTTVRNYFLSNGFKKQYKKTTRRSFNSHKIARFNQILNKYNLIKVYKVKKKPNLYVLGTCNPCYYFQGIMEAETIKTVHRLINDNNYHHVNVTPKDRKIKELEETGRILREEIEALKKEMMNFKSKAEQVNTTSADYKFVIEKNTELLNENSQLKTQQERIGKWHIACKPVAMYNFDEKFKDLLKYGPNRKIGVVPDKIEDIEEQSDYMKDILEVTEGLSSHYGYDSQW